MGMWGLCQRRGQPPETAQYERTRQRGQAGQRRAGKVATPGTFPRDGNETVGPPKSVGELQVSCR